MSSAMCKVERSALAECEEIVERGLASFIEVGNALVKAKATMKATEFRKLCLEKTGMHPDELEPAIELFRSLV